jgi:hypothetical protein
MREIEKSTHIYNASVRNLRISSFNLIQKNIMIYDDTYVHVCITICISSKQQ